MKAKEVAKLLTQEGERIAGCIVGAALYALGVNMFIVSSGFYTGGILGICQVIRTLLVDYLNLPIHDFDIAGIIYYLVNIPILFLAFTRIGRKFFAKTLITVTAMSFFLSIYPVQSIISDRIACSIVGGILAGIGTGITLRMGASSGGADILGVMLIRWKQNFSVGKMNLLVNLVLYATCLFLFDVETVIYSVIYAAVYATAVDRIHIQNINIEAHIITKIHTGAMEKEIFEELNRGITRWETQGAYTNEISHILYITLSKYELHRLKAIVHKYDPYAFIVTNEGVQIEGHYLKKL